FLRQPGRNKQPHRRIVRVELGRTLEQLPRTRRLAADLKRDGRRNERARLRGEFRQNLLGNSRTLLVLAPSDIGEQLQQAALECFRAAVERIPEQRRCVGVSSRGELCSRELQPQQVIGRIERSGLLQIKQALPGAARQKAG